MTRAARAAPATGPGGSPARRIRPVPLLFLVADTGGGHRTAARAVGQALARLYPGAFAPVYCDPLTGPAAPTLARRVMRLYGPVARHAPWLWGAAYRAVNSPAAMSLLHGTLLSGVSRAVTAAASFHQPAAIVSFHPLAGLAATDARDRLPGRLAVATVVTDLTAAHAAWRAANADLFIGPGLPPVTREFWAGPASRAERGRLRRSLGLEATGKVILLAGGAEGGGGITRRARAILRGCPDASVVAVCGRNRLAARRLQRLAGRHGGRLIVCGYTDAMAAWLRCADLVATKAGPGMIAEAACCGVPLLVTSQLPGQERDNAGLVTAAGAGLRVRGRRRLAGELRRLHDDPGAIERMGAAAARLARPEAAFEVAVLIAGLVAARARGPARTGPAPGGTRGRTIGVLG